MVIERLRDDDMIPVYAAIRDRAGGARQGRARRRRCAPGRAKTAQTVVVVLGLILAVVASGAASAKDICDSPVTTDIVACAEKQLREAQTSLDRHLAEVRAAIADRPADLAALEAAQKAWSAFVDLDCKAVYEHWIDGTVRGPFSLLQGRSHRGADLRPLGHVPPGDDHQARGAEVPGPVNEAVSAAISPDRTSRCRAGAGGSRGGMACSRAAKGSPDPVNRPSP